MGCHVQSSSKELCAISHWSQGCVCEWTKAAQVARASACGVGRSTVALAATKIHRLKPVLLLGLDQLLLQALSLVVRHQRVDERSELAVHHFGELVQRQADAMVGHAILRKIVRANFLRAVAGLDLSKPLG